MIMKKQYVNPVIEELLLVEGAPHTLSILHNPELAGKRLQGFFGKYFT